MLTTRKSEKIAEMSPAKKKHEKHENVENVIYYYLGMSYRV